MAFEAGSIHATLELDRTPFQQGLRQARADADAFEKRRVTAKVDADTAAADRKLAATQAEASRLDGKTANVKADADTGAADAKLAVTQAEADHLDGKNINVKVDQRGLARLGLLGVALSKLGGAFTSFGGQSQAGMGAAMSGASGVATAVIALSPLVPAVLGPLAGAVMALGTAFAAAGLGAVAFGGVAVTAFSKAMSVQDKVEKLRQQAANSSGKQRKAYLDEAKALEGTLTPAEKKMGDALDNIKNAWGRLSDTMSPLVWKALQPFIGKNGVILQGMRLLAPLVKPAANAIHTLGDAAKKAIGSPFWQHFVDIMGKLGGKAILDFGKAIGDLATGFAGLMVAFAPIAAKMLPDIVKLADRFAKWGTSVGQSSGFHKFIDYMQKNGPHLVSIIGSLATIAFKLMVALAPLGSLMLTGLTDFLKLVSKLSPDELLGIAAGIGAVTLAIAILSDSTMVGVVGSILLLVSLAALIVKNWGPISGFFKRLWRDVKRIASDVAHWFTGPFLHFFTHTIPNGFKRGWNAVKNHVMSAVHGAQNVARTVAHWFTGPFVGFFTRTIPNAFRRGWNAVRNHVSTILHGAENVAKTVAHWFTGPFVGFFVHTIPNAFKRGWNAARNHVVTILHGAENTAKTVAHWFTGPFVGFFTKTVPNAFKRGWTAAKNHAVNLLHTAENGAKTVAHWFTRPFLDFYTKTVPNGFKHGWTLAKNHALQILHLARTGALVIAHWFTGPFVDFFTKTIPNGFLRGFRNAKNNALHQFTILRNGLHDAWGWVHDHVFTPMVNFVTDTIPHAFKRGAQLAGQGWNAIKNLAKAPVNFLITTVYDKGIRGIVGKIADWVNLKGGNPLPYVHALAAGGPVPAAAAGRVAAPTAIVGEGRPGYPEYVIPTDPQYRSRALGLFDQVASHLLARGGTVAGGDQSVPMLASGGTIASLVAFGRALQRAHWRVSENPHFGGVHPVHTRGSLHYSGRAIDVNWAAGQSKAEQAKIDALIRSGIARSQYGLRSIWRYPGHFDHVHFDTGAGPDLGMHQGGGGGIGGFLAKLLSPLSMIKDAITGPVKAMVGKFGNSPWVKMLGAIPGKLAGDMAHKVESLLTSLLPTGAGGGHAVAATGPVADIVRRTASQFGWGSGPEWAALSWLISAESGWNPRAQNPSSSAYGLFQFLNGTWGSVGGHKTSNPALQALYGMRYIKSKYHDPIRAKSFHLSHNWYDTSTVAKPGILRPGATLALNGTGRNEYITDRPPGGGADRALVDAVARLVAVFSRPQTVQLVVDDRTRFNAHISGLASQEADRALSDVVRAAQLGRK